MREGEREMVNDKMCMCVYISQFLSFFFLREKGEGSYSKKNLIVSLVHWVLVYDKHDTVEKKNEYIRK